MPNIIFNIPLHFTGITSCIYTEFSLKLTATASVAQSVGRWSIDPASRVRFTVVGLRVAFFATALISDTWIYLTLKKSIILNMLHMSRILSETCFTWSICTIAHYIYLYTCSVFKYCETVRNWWGEIVNFVLVLRTAYRIRVSENTEIVVFQKNWENKRSWC